jgi:type II secretory pathway component PulK
MDEIYMSGYLQDEQSKFNINDLVASGQVNPNVLSQFTALLGYLNLPQSLAYNIAYYMAAPQFQSDIMQQYIRGKPAYRPAGRPLVDLSELILVKGMTPEINQKLVQYVTAIPVNGYGLTVESMESAAQNNKQATLPVPTGFGSVVNVNTASAEVIAAKGGIPLNVAQRMISYRNSQPFKTTQDITTFLTTNGVNTSSNNTPNKNGPTLNISGLGVS